jgi:hypothetical protein
MESQNPPLVVFLAARRTNFFCTYPAACGRHVC